MYITGCSAPAHSLWGLRAPAVLALLCLLVACGNGREGTGQETADQQPARRVLTMTVGTTQTDTEAAFVGTIAARNISNQGFRVSGAVSRRLVEVGQHVTVGQALLQIDPANLLLTRQQAQAQVDAAKSKAAQAKVNLERDAELLKQNFISQAEYDRDKVTLETDTAQLHAAQAQYGEATNQVDYGTLRAAIAGVVTAIDADVGQVVNSGKTVVSIARDGDREVVISIPESRVNQLRTATGLSVTLWAVPGKSWQARLREIDPAATKTSGTYDAHVTVLDPDASMLLGMTAYVHTRDSVASQPFAIPLTALAYANHDPAVWKVATDGIVKTHPVKLDPISGGTAHVASGLEKGDVIVTKGGDLLHEGEKVEPIAEPQTGH